MEKIKEAAIRVFSGKIYTGKRHCDCIMAAGKAGETGSLDREQGFMTESGRFVGRREAREIAEKAGQLIERASKGNILYSEDIY